MAGGVLSGQMRVKKSIKRLLLSSLVISFVLATILFSGYALTMKMFKPVYATKSVDIDFKNEKFTLGEQIGDKNTVKSFTIDKISKMTYKDYAILLLQPSHASIGDKEIMVFSDFTLNSVEGTIYLVEPRVEHTHE